MGRNRTGRTTLYLSAAALPPRDGDERDRTADLLNAIQALSQLSYAPGRDSLQKTGAAPLWSRAQKGVRNRAV